MPRAFHITSECPACDDGWLMVRRNRRDGSPFIGCSRFPRCDFTAVYDEYVQELAARVMTPQGDAAELTAKIEAACRKLLMIVHPDRLLRHPTEAHDATKIILALRQDARGLADDAD